MNNELNALVNELNYKKDILATKTSSIVEGIKDWCLGENDRLKNEFDGLVGFLNENITLFFKKTSHRCYTDTYYLDWNGLRIVGNFTNGTYANFRSVGIDTDYEYKCNFGIVWSKLPKPMKYKEYQFFDKTDMNNTDVTYWTDYKRCLAIRNEYLLELTKKIKDYLGTLILEQDTRFNEMNKACKEIDEDNTKTIEIKVKVRV